MPIWIELENALAIITYAPITALTYPAVIALYQ